MNFIFPEKGKDTVIELGIKKDKLLNYSKSISKAQSVAKLNQEDHAMWAPYSASCSFSWFHWCPSILLLLSGDTKHEYGKGKKSLIHQPNFHLVVTSSPYLAIIFELVPITEHAL